MTGAWVCSRCRCAIEPRGRLVDDLWAAMTAHLTAAKCGGSLRSVRVQEVSQCG